MRFVDAYILARTKRKTRRIRTAIVIIVCSLLFALLFGAAFVGQGVIDAAKQVKDVGFNSRNLTTIASTSSFYFDYPSKASSVEAEMISELKARKIKVTDTTKQDASYQAELMRRMNEIISQQQRDQLKKAEGTIKTLGSPSAIYHFTSVPLSQMAAYQPDPAVDPQAKDFKEQEVNGGAASQKGGFGPNGPQQLEFFMAESDMFRTQLQPVQTFGWQPGKPYPLIISYGYLEKLAGRSFAKLGAAERNQGYREIIKKFTGHELLYCYRNTVAQDQLRTVIHYNQLAETDTDTSTKPIDLPFCADFDQKLLKNLELITETDPGGMKPLFPPAATIAPESKQVRFKIVGFVPAQQQYGTSDVITQVLASVSVLPTSPNPGILPAEVVANDPTLKNLMAEQGNSTYTALFADFKTRAEQKAFIDKGCSGNDCVGGAKPYIASFGNIAIALEGFFRFFAKFLLIAMGVIMFIAALMTMFTISKVIADSTKEIAVFRSLGARRRDIVHIYYTYGFMLAGSALLLAAGLAIIGALVATSFFHQKIADGLVQAAGAYNISVHVTLLGIRITWLVYIIAALLVAAAIGIAVPVLASVRRKLITILREE